ncbi:MAG: MoaD/ThiS family protein [Candidatus Omnitrophica bacterium]|nr:MoaD/ThiS family protein [Candidatus Omnitrophota bacterium]
MKVRVLFFAQLQDVFGERERVVEIEDGITMRKFVEPLLRELKGDGWTRFPLRYAVNEKFEDGDTKLCSGDVLALIPPVSGG